MVVRKDAAKLQALAEGADDAGQGKGGNLIGECEQAVLEAKVAAAVDFR
jgi:hypothetical protein